ncbi:hypothetical protein [Mucilaginibacter sp. HD30]
MNEYTRNSANGFFYDLLDNPADLSDANAFKLQQLINEFPQSGLLRSILAVKREEESLHSASTYVNPKLLYVIANAVGSLLPVSDEQIVICQKPGDAKVVLPLPKGLELPNPVVDESNYFHIPIDPDLAYKAEEQTEEIEVFEEDPEIEDADKEVEVATAVIDHDTEIHNEVAEENETAEGAVLLSEDDTEIAEEKRVEEDAALSLEIDAEVAEENQTEEKVVPTSQTEAEVAEEITAAGEQPEHPAVTEQTKDIAVETEYTKADIKPTQTYDEIDDEVFDEIVSIEDIGLEQLAVLDKVADEAEQNVINDLAEQEETGDLIETEETPHPTETEAAHDPEETEETAVANNYFVLEPTLPADEEYREPSNVATRDVRGNQSRQRVSRYNDEKLPYSFMWWLDKTRKEHAAIYQPFAVEGKFHTETVTPEEKPQAGADHLQQQYVENIFAVSSVVSDLKVIPPKEHAPSVETKADKIIEKFIHEEPQIKHPSKAKLDSENKAKKSSEDRDELVTETLAKIYTEQMLYHKAILTYKKLMLKFPEKSLYFAGQIEQLENKIN